MRSGTDDKYMNQRVAIFVYFFPEETLFTFEIKINNTSYADPEGGQGVQPPPPLKNHKKYSVSLQYWSGSPGKTQSYQASIQ